MCNNLLHTYHKPFSIANSMTDITLASGRCDGNGYARWLVKMVSGKCESIDIALASGRCDGNSYARQLVAKCRIIDIAPAGGKCDGNVYSRQLSSLR